MALNIVNATGNFDPYVKFNGKSGRWYCKKGEQEVEINPTSFIADLQNIKTGWLLFFAGQAPQKTWDVDLKTPAEKPSHEHKRGFSLRLYSPATFGGVVELSANSMHVCASINDLYVAFEAEKDANQGKVPVVKFTGTTPMKDKQGTNYKPNFVIEKWVARPAELDAAPVAQQANNNVAPAPVVAAVSEF